MNRNLRLVTASLFAWGIGEGMFILFQPLYLKELGADPLMIGAILGGMGIAMSLAQIPTGYLSDKIGTRPLMWASWIMATIAAWIMAAANSLAFFTVGIILFGLTNSVLVPMNAYITNARGDWTTERALTTTTAAYHLGTVFGPLLGGILGSHFSLRFLYFIAAIVFIFSTLFVLFIENIKISDSKQAKQSTSLRSNTSFIRLVPLGFLAIFFMFFTQPLSPVFLEEIQNLDLQLIGYLGAIGSLGNVVLALVFGRMKAKTAYLLSFPFVIAYSLMMASQNQFILLALAYFLYGGYRLARTMLLALTRQIVHAAETGVAFGFIETLNGLATILAPPISGLLYQQNPHSIYWVSIIGLLISGIINMIYLPKTPERTL